MADLFVRLYTQSLTDTTGGGISTTFKGDVQKKQPEEMIQCKGAKERGWSGEKSGLIGPKCERGGDKSTGCLGLPKEKWIETQKNLKPPHVSRLKPGEFS